MANGQYNNNIYDYIIGDYDNDGYVTTEDAQDCSIISTELINYNYPPFPVSGSSTFEALPQQVFCCDIDGDGDITAEDAQRIILYYVENTVNGNGISYDEMLRPIDNTQGLVFYGYYVKSNTDSAFYYDADKTRKIKPLYKCYYYDLTPGQNNQLYVYYNTTHGFIKISQIVSTSKLVFGTSNLDSSGKITSFTPDQDEGGQEVAQVAWNYYLDKGTGKDGESKGLFIYAVSPMGTGGYYIVN